MSKNLDLFFDRIGIEKIPSRRVRWKTTYRLVSARHPPIHYFERIADSEDRGVLDDLEKLTDPGHRHSVGHISLVPPRRRVFGAGATSVMYPFTHPSKDNASRFTDGSFGMYYAGHKFETALREVAFHRARFHARTKDPATNTPFRTISGSLNKTMHDIRRGSWVELLDPDPLKYNLPQTLGTQLKESGSNGIVYPSVRHPGGECVGAFWPNVVGPVSEGKRIKLRWDGQKISAWLDSDTGEWIDLDM